MCKGLFHLALWCTQCLSAAFHELYILFTFRWKKKMIRTIRKANEGIQQKLSGYSHHLSYRIKNQPIFCWRCVSTYGPPWADSDQGLILLPTLSRRKNPPGKKNKQHAPYYDIIQGSQWCSAATFHSPLLTYKMISNRCPQYHLDPSVSSWYLDSLLYVFFHPPKSKFIDSQFSLLDNQRSDKQNEMSPLNHNDESDMPMVRVLACNQPNCDNPLILYPIQMSAPVMDCAMSGMNAG